MVTLTLEEKHARILIDILGFYADIGIGKMDKIKEHPTFKNLLKKQCTYHDSEIDYEKKNSISTGTDMMFTATRNMLWNRNDIGQNGSLGIFNTDTDESCRIAWDILQIIRHEFWKKNPDKLPILADSIHYSSKENTRAITCTITKDVKDRTCKRGFRFCGYPCFSRC